MLQLLLGIWLSLAPQETGGLQGTVKRGGTSEPLGTVEIALIGAADRSRRRTTSDEQGRFFFDNVPLGRYSIQASREGYFTYPLGRPLPSPVASITVDSTRTQQVVIDLVPGSVIGGRVTDPQGRPLQGVQVNATKLQYDEGRPAFGAGSVPRTTDDRGEYRLFWLAPGEYYIRAEYPAGQNGLARKSYYPGTVDSNAAVPLNLHSGESLDGTNLTIPIASSVTIAGQVALDGAGPAAGVVRTFYLLPQDGRPAEVYPLEFTNTIGPLPGGQPTSAFSLDIRGVPPGLYDLAPFYMDPSTTYHSGRTRIEIGNQNIENLTAVITPNVGVSGRFLAQGDLALPTWRAFQLQLRAKDASVPLMSRSSLAKIEDDGTFVIPSVFEGRYQVYLGASPGSIASDLYIAAIRQGALDVRNEGFIDARASMLPLEITIASGAGVIQGTVDAPGGTIPSHADVVLVPHVSRRGNVMFYDRTVMDDKGQFKFQGIAPGEYKVFAFEQLADSAEQNSAFIARYEALGQAVTVNSKSSTEIRVRLLR
jgi:Carboxypeptidase regulatory-like domain